MPSVQGGNWIWYILPEIQCCVWIWLSTMPANQQAVYVGETARNVYSRCREHSRNFEKEESELFIFKLQRDEHHGAQADFKASMKYWFKDCLSILIAEGVAIRRCDKNVLNSKAEWHQPAIWRVRSELSREWENWLWHNSVDDCGWGKLGCVNRVWTVHEQ